MASILDSKPEVSDVVLYEDFKEYGHTRAALTTTRTTAFEIGMVVKVVAGVYSGVTDAQITAGITTDVAVVIDDTVYDVTAGNVSTVLLQMPAGGAAGIKRSGLKFLDAVGAANLTKIEVLLAAKGIKTYTTV